MAKYFHSEEEIVKTEEMLFGGKTDEEVGQLMAVNMGMVPETAIYTKDFLPKWKRVQAEMRLDIYQSMIELAI